LALQKSYLVKIGNLLRRTVLFVLRVFKEIKEKNIEAKRIIEDAKAQAEEMKEKAQQKSSKVYEITYNRFWEKANQEALELTREAARATEIEIEKIRSSSENAAKEIEEKAKKNFEEAVECALNIVLGGS
jgi:vacuolar-type H+-ATPase subunit H